MFRRILLSFLAVVALLVTAVFAAPFIIPAKTIKTEVEKVIAQATGWKIRFSGDVNVSLFPSVRLVASNIEVSPPDHKPILRAEEARFAVGLSALLGGAIDIEEIAFQRPDLTIELNEAGNPVWRQSEAQTSVKTSQSTTQETKTAPRNVDGIIISLIDTLRVQRLAIQDAKITYGIIGETPTQLDAITLEASLQDPQGPLIVQGSARLDDDPVTLNGEISAFKSLLSSGKGGLSVQAQYKNAIFKSSGDVDTNGQTLFDGTIESNITDISEIAGKQTLAPGEVTAKGRLVVGKEELNLTLEQSRFLDSAIFSNLTLRTTGPRPFLSGSIDLGDLNLDKILATARADATQNSSSAQSGASQNGTDADLSGLGAIDTDITFTSKSVSAGKHEVRNLKGRLILNDGAASLTLDQLEAAGGSASASLSTNVKSNPLTTYGEVKLNSLSLATLLALAQQDALQKQLSGNIGADLIFGFQGITSEDVAATVNARGTVSLSNAAVSGLGLAGVVGDDGADKVDQINIKTTIDRLVDPITVDGRARWNGETISINLTTDPSALISGRDAQTDASISFSHATTTFSGVVSPSLPISGTLSTRGKSLRSLARWVGSELPPGDGFGAFSIKTKFKAEPAKVSLENLSLNLDDLKGTGNATILLTDKPDISANVNFDLLDVNPYIATPAEGASVGGQTATRSSTKWSNDPIDFSFLNAANLSLTANVNTLKAEGLTVGPLAMKTTMRGGKLDAKLTNMGFYGGSGNAQVIINASEQTPTVSAQLKTRNIDALPFLTDAANFSRIEGFLNLDLDITSQGKSQSAFVSALNGRTSFSFNDGAIRGINIARSMRALTSGVLNGWNKTDAEKTDFSAFTASFNIANGIATNDDLNLVGPLVRVSGAGEIQMPPQTLKYRVNPKVVASLKGQGGASDLAGFAVPIIVEGPWAKPRIYPDIKGFLQNPAAGLAQLNSLGGGFAAIANGKPGDLLAAVGSNPKTVAVAKAADAVQQKTGINIQSLVKDGKIDKQAGVAAAVGAVTSILGSQTQADVPNRPVLAGDSPFPRPRPDYSVTSNPIQEIVGQVVKPQTSEGTPLLPNLSVIAPENAENLVKGLGGLFGQQKN